MSVYFLRHGNLIKIGYSSHLAQRVAAIMSAVPGEVAFLGHMPGERDLEAHLHERFSAVRFSGEWFFETPDILEFARIALDPVMPVDLSIDRVIGSRRPEARQKMLWAKGVLRNHCAVTWPQLNHQARMLLLAEQTGWLLSRVQDIYAGHRNAVLRATELPVIEALERVLEPKITTSRENGRGSDR